MALMALLMGLLAACTPAAPTGPAFFPAPEPAAGRGRIYVYRLDPSPSHSTVALALDGARRGSLRHGESASFELAAGPHRIGLRQHGLAFSSFGWNGEDFRVAAGETVFFEVSVRVSGQPIPAMGREVEIAGRASGSASENVFVQRRGREAALERLAKTTQRVE